MLAVAICVDVKASWLMEQVSTEDMRRTRLSLTFVQYPHFPFLLLSILCSQNNATALIIAAENGYSAVCEGLLKLGADPNSTDVVSKPNNVLNPLDK